MNLVLIGYRGTGKSQVGRLVARRTRMPCVRMDEEIERQAAMSIPEIVAQFGWPHFRDLETELVRKLARRDNTLIDTGGGVIERGENVELLRRSACVIWLRASVATIVRRIEGGTRRPALTAGKSFTEQVAEVLERRTPLYASASHFQIDTDQLAPAQVAQRVIEIWEEWKKEEGHPA
jgi:shikimate kinase